MEPIVDDLKAEARHLHRAAKAGHPRALTRLRRLPALRKLPDAALAEGVLRRHCLSAVARELGLSGWSHLRALLRDADTSDFGALLYGPGCSAHWNIWSASYEEAARIRGEHGGYLLPYKHQFVIVERDFLESLGLDLDHEDLARVGHDWVRPQDAFARRRLCCKLLQTRLAALRTGS